MNRTQPNVEKEAAVVIGRNLQSFRLEASMSQKKLGEHLGVTDTQVRKYESGRDMLNSYKMFACAKILGCSMDDFFRDYPKDQMPAQQARSLIVSSADDRFFKDYLALPTVLKELARTMLRTWRKELVAKGKTEADTPPE